MPLDAPLTLLKNGRVFAPRPLGLVDILVGGGQILAVQPNIPRFEGANASFMQVIELDGARVIPGLIDGHVHVTGGGGEGGPHTRVPAVLFSELTRAGVTTCIGVLGTDSTSRNVESLVAGTLALRHEGLSAYCFTGSYEVPPVTVTGNVRKDICFIDPILGLGEIAISDHRSSQPTKDELARLAGDCHVSGILSQKAGILHLHMGNGPRGLSMVNALLDQTELPPRVFHPTHVNRKKALMDEAILLAKRGSTIDVTAFPVDEGEDAYSAEDAIERYLTSGAPHENITCSSDGGGCLPTYNARGELTDMDTGSPSALAHTLRTLLLRGHALETVLPCFTENVARLFRLAGKGHISGGASADLVVLDEHHEVRDVMARGKFVVRAKKPLVFGTFEKASS